MWLTFVAIPRVPHVTDILILELLFGNSLLELIAPLKEIAEQNDKLGVDFRNKGMINVDYCCNVKDTVLKALPNIGVNQDLWHLMNHILTTVSKNGDSDGYVNPEIGFQALLPPTSPLLQRKRKQGDVDNEASLPKKARDSSLKVSENIQESLGSAMELSIDISMNLNEGNILSPVQSVKISEVINRNEEDIWILKLSILKVSTMMNCAPCSPCDNMLSQIIPESSNLMSPSITEETVSFSQLDHECSMEIEAGSTSHAAVQPSKAMHSTFGSMPSISTTAAAKSKRESRTAAYFTAETSAQASDFIKANQIKFSDDCYYHWATLRLQYGWTSTLSDTKWDEIANIYNNPATVISPYNYNPDFDVPMDPVQWDGALLKVWCIEFDFFNNEELMSVAEISWWKLQQLRVLLPKQTSKLVYEKPTKNGKEAEVKMCQRCNHVKDGKGVEKNNHRKFYCSDGMPNWSKIPYPMDNMGLTLTYGLRTGAQNFSGNGCLSAFREAIKKEKELYGVDEQLIDPGILNVPKFRADTRVNAQQSREEALLQGATAYNLGYEKWHIPVKIRRRRRRRSILLSVHTVVFTVFIHTLYSLLKASQGESIYR
ncbi:hypothetical protein M422DRAFT_251568 [Sphaerobolus stellatus SS14]|uniref:Unplaced genomic scaffold SPHSTscaffold_39, whole genome shotgun sequence n=1 Tax=Sphaerobolus stellatus (strain SS14) TaxID=990650 RepID=A0A0C9VRE9_SPHS4|nr:hypothetical protein M422DRAFT_251568 [Sphaerobolus stellatus SS14]